jgi:8-amino-3,8-dideoxy-alpha-D-manno-octulosonate transaminase
MLDTAVLAINGGTPVRTEPLPLEFPGVHFMDEEEVEAVTAVVRSRSLFRYYGPAPRGEVKQFEQEMAAAFGVRRCIATGSGTGALHAALGALGVGPGQEVIVPAYSWISVAAAVVQRGGVPVVADIDDTFCLDPAAVERAITPHTAGIMLVHMSGAPGDAAAITEVAKRRGLWLLEDCAQCNGGSIGGKPVGSFGDMAIVSFQLNKNMTAGEGGVMLTSDERLYNRAFACHDLGYARNEAGRMILNDPEMTLWGLGCRMDEMRGALLRVQLRKRPRIVGAMRASKYRIRESLARFEEVQLRRVPDPAGDTGCFLITTYRDAARARWVSDALRAEGVRTAPGGVSNIVMTDWGLHLYSNWSGLERRVSIDGKGFPWTIPANAGLGGKVERGACPVADGLFERSILIAIPSNLTQRDEDDVIAAFAKVLGATA